MPEVTVRLQDVALGYLGPSGPRVVEHVSCAALAGTITVLIGPNASGKSSVLRAIGGHLLPLAGSIDVLGAAPHRIHGAALARRIAFVAQRGTVSAPFRVREVVAMGRFALPPDEARLRTALDAVGLAEESNRIFAELSAGQQQRVLLARALAQLEPGAVLLLDEPTSAMDLPAAGRTLGLLRDLAENGATIVLALHDLLQAQRIADAVWLFGGGVLAGEGSARVMLSAERLTGIFGVPFVSAEVPGEPSRLIPAR